MTLFDGLVANAGGERRTMFGCPTMFVRGQMSAGLFGEALFFRLGEAERAALLAQPGAHLFDPMGGRPMKEYVVAPEALLDDEEALAGWLEKARAYAASLGPKPKKVSAASKARPRGRARRAP